MHIAPFEQGNIHNHEPKRKRRLLVHKREAVRWRSKVNEKGYTIVPTEIYFSGHLVKVEIAMVKPKKKFDKRESIKRKDVERDMKRTLKNY